MSALLYLLLLYKACMLHLSLLLKLFWLDLSNNYTPGEDKHIWKRGGERCASENNWLETRFIKTGQSASLPHWPLGAFQGENSPRSYGNLQYSTGTRRRCPMKTTSGLFLRQHHPRKQTTRAEPMPPGATWRNSLYIAPACHSVWKTAPPAH